MSTLLNRRREAGGSPVAAAPRKRRSLSLRLNRESVGSALFLLPALALLTIFFVVPAVLQLVLAFTDWNVFQDEIGFVGLDNFREIVDAGVLENSVKVTLILAGVTFLVQTTLGLGLALALEQPTRVNWCFRAFFFLPVLISPLAAGYIFRGLLSVDGPLNAALSTLLSDEIHFEWFGDPTWTLVIVATIVAWKWYGLTMIVYIAGLNAIPGELLEAAEIDGAGPFTRFWRVKLPVLMPAITFNVVLTVIGTLQVFDVVFATTRGGPGTATEVLNLVVYDYFGQGLFGLAMSMSVVVLAIVTFLALPLLIALRRREVEL